MPLKTRRFAGFVVLVLALAAASCTRSDSEQARHDLKTSGAELKKELKSDARVLKREAVKAGHEARDEAEKARRELNSDLKDKDTSRP